MFVHLQYFRRSWYVPAPRLDHLDSAQLQLVSTVMTSSSSNSKNLTFQAKCRSALVLSRDDSMKYMCFGKLYQLKFHYAFLH